VPTTRCSKREAYSRLLRPQRWMRRDASLHGLLPIQATHAGVRSWSHNLGVASAQRRTPSVMEGKFDKVVAPRPRAIPPAQKVRRLAKLSEQICGVGHSA
jgi:hypothetical protein